MIPSHRKVMQKLQKKPTPKQSLRFFNPAKTWGAGMLPLYRLVSNTGTLFPARDIARSLLIKLELLWRPAFCVTYLLWKSVVQAVWARDLVPCCPCRGPPWALALISDQVICTLSPSFIGCRIAFMVRANGYQSSLERLRRFVHPPLWRTQWTRG